MYLLFNFSLSVSMMILCLYVLAKRIKVFRTYKNLTQVNVDQISLNTCTIASFLYSPIYVFAFLLKYSCHCFSS